MKAILPYTWLILVFLLCGSNSTFAQPYIHWQHAYGGADFDGAYDIVPADGGYTFTGESSSSNGDIVNSNNGNSDYWLCKISEDGTLIWENSFGGPGYERAFGLVNTGTGYVVGGEILVAGGEISTAYGNGDIWIIKTDSSGDLMWEKTYGGSAYDEFSSIQQSLGDSGYIFTASTSSSDHDITYNHGGSLDAWVVNINDAGVINWQKTYGGSDLDEAQNIQKTSDGGYIFAGLTKSVDGDVIINHGSADCWIVKLDDTGRIQWQKTYGGSEVDGAQYIQQTSDGGYIVEAATLSADGDVTTYHPGNGFDIWVYKLDSVGTLLWDKTYGGTADDMPAMIKQVDSGYIFSAYTNSHDGDVVAPVSDSTDYWVVKINDTGAIVWQKAIGGTKQDQAWAMALSPSGDCTLAGSSYSDNGDVSGNHGEGDCWLVQLGEHPEKIPQIPKENIKVYPSPTNRVIHIDFPTANQIVNVKLLNVLGQNIKFTEDINGSNYLINMDGVSYGLYLLQIECDGMMNSYKILYQK